MQSPVPAEELVISASNMESPPSQQHQSLDDSKSAELQDEVGPEQWSSTNDATSALLAPRYPLRNAVELVEKEAMADEIEQAKRDASDAHRARQRVEEEMKTVRVRMDLLEEENRRLSYRLAEAAGEIATQARDREHERGTMQEELQAASRALERAFAGAVSETVEATLREERAKDLTASELQAQLKDARSRLAATASQVEDLVHRLERSEDERRRVRRDLQIAREQLQAALRGRVGDRRRRQSQESAGHRQLHRQQDPEDRDRDRDRDGRGAVVPPSLPGPGPGAGADPDIDADTDMQSKDGRVTSATDATRSIASGGNVEGSEVKVHHWQQQGNGLEAWKAAGAKQDHDRAVHPQHDRHSPPPPAVSPSAGNRADSDSEWGTRALHAGAVSPISPGQSSSASGAHFGWGAGASHGGAGRAAVGLRVGSDRAQSRSATALHGSATRNRPASAMPRSRKSTGATSELHGGAGHGYHQRYGLSSSGGAGAGAGAVAGAPARLASTDRHGLRTRPHSAMPRKHGHSASGGLFSGRGGAAVPGALPPLGEGGQGSGSASHGEQKGTRNSNQRRRRPLTASMHRLVRNRAVAARKDLLQGGLATEGGGTFSGPPRPGLKERATLRDRMKMKQDREGGAGLVSGIDGSSHRRSEQKQPLLPAGLDALSEPSIVARLEGQGTGDGGTSKTGSRYAQKPMQSRKQVGQAISSADNSSRSSSSRGVRRQRPRSAMPAAGGGRGGWRPAAEQRDSKSNRVRTDQAFIQQGAVQEELAAAGVVAGQRVRVPPIASGAGLQEGGLQGDKAAVIGVTGGIASGRQRTAREGEVKGWSPRPVGIDPGSKGAVVAGTSPPPSAASGVRMQLPSGREK